MKLEDIETVLDHIHLMDRKFLINKVMLAKPTAIQKINDEWVLVFMVANDRGGFRPFGHPISKLETDTKDVIMIED